MRIQTRQSVRSFSANFVGNGVKELLDYRNESFRGRGLEAGVSVKLGTSTTVDLVIKDSEGTVIFRQANITADVENVVTVKGVVGNLTATATNNSNSTHTFEVIVRIRQ